MDKYEPPFTITKQILNLVGEIMNLLGKLSPVNDLNKQPRLRRINRLKSIHSSCAIEGNTLSLEQVSAIIDGKVVIAPRNEIQEIQNAFKAYELMDSIDPFSIADVLKAHETMMVGLIDEIGRFRSGGVGVFDGTVAVHIAPQAKFVHGLMEQLLDWTKKSDYNPLIKYCVFHYEFEFIHPFQDGNGRMGRFLQSCMLAKWEPIFAYLPVENIVRERQQQYYEALKSANQKADSTNFITYMLEAILEAVKKGIDDTNKYAKAMNEYVHKLLDVMDFKPMSAKEISQALGLKSIQGLKKTYLEPALKMGYIAMTEPNKPTSQNQKYYKV